MSTLTIAALSVALLGMLFSLVAYFRLKRRRFLAAGGNGITACCLLSLAGLGFAVGLNLHTYQRLTHEQPVATLEFRELAPRQYLARLSLPESDEVLLFEIYGDEWQLDARILKWQGIATVLGFDTQYRLERIAGRYQDVEGERSQPRSVYALSDDAGVDLWRLARDNQRWLPWVDAYYGSAAYLPMREGAQYQIAVTQSGLVARPVNQSARDAVGGWR
ncbi:hypothetical protein CAI21_17765 [Alkalilimnicola ehrlichii]|uniref:Cation/multidrug efflux pump n=1 Tax=Alkalilimnicola ehrlichii TaxID=351052 RepID=A0A3E0WIK1_9GAMM|nr:cation/multidrug efflux pump [Alkalilimnicola ehrlichii]RFA26176.1 hypothetical protein CAI21_17765 [Alkalilimnicola ehrlichii]RFA31695.1 hypothetical protein CAL65_21665 [Alkalilimnicola ehrlichii]